MKKIGLIGAGSWGTAIAITLAGKGYEVHIWDVDKDHVAALKHDRENKKYLPGITFEENIIIEDEAIATVTAADVVVFSAPAQHFRSALRNVKDSIPEHAIAVNVAKGIEQKTLKTMSQVAADEGLKNKYVVLSGPSHAEEVGRKIPTSIVVASEDIDAALEAQDIFMTSRMRVYTAIDVLGVELGGSLKNIIALGAGISDGMGYGDNTKAAMMTRGIAEMQRLGIKMGAHEDTFSGLTGIGDLIVTCTSVHSRNRRCGLMIGEGVAPEEARERVGMVVEGVFTAEAAYQLAQKLDVDMPITEAIYKVTRSQLDPADAVAILMGRDKRPEHDKNLGVIK